MLHKMVPQLAKMLDCSEAVSLVTLLSHYLTNSRTLSATRSAACFKSEHLTIVKV